MTKMRNPGADLRKDVREAIERAWPDGVVEMAFDSGESLGFTEMRQRIEPEAEFREFKGERAFGILLKLRGRICDILGRYGIGVLPEEEWRKPAPWLRADEEILVSTTGEPVRVLDALFFEGL